MASHCLSVFTREELAEQARAMFASMARAVPPPARSVPLPAQQSPDHLCRGGSPHRGTRGAGSTVLPALRSPAGGDTLGPLIRTKAAALFTSACISTEHLKSWERGSCRGVALGESFVLEQPTRGLPCIP